MTESFPPPIYSKQDPDDPLAKDEEADAQIIAEPQILIIPPADALNFQKGFLGAEGERAAIEGELQIKGIKPEDWLQITMSLRIVETAYQHEIELASSKIVLFTRPPISPAIFPSSFPFSIPLSADTPQSIETPHSSLSHYLTATLHPADPLLPSVSKTLTVHTRRYSGHACTIPLDPETHTLEAPTRVEVQVPRATFKADELIPLYITVPPPTRELVVDRGLRLRNVRAELVRSVGVKRANGEQIPQSDTDINHNEKERLQGETSVNGDAVATPISSHSDKASSSKSPIPPFASGISLKTVVARSGASCRFHSSRPVRLRFILHQFASLDSPPNLLISLPSEEYAQLDSHAECASITQLTILHSITFELNVHISFVDVSTHREHISIISVPITVVPSPAPLPEVPGAVDAAYQKKHDQPPSKTVRHEEVDISASPLVPNYSEGEAGPSILLNTAPPPFEERDAPPPFFFSEAGGSTSTRLPTFLESESEIIIPEDVGHNMGHQQPSPSIEGEGLMFGFPSSQQFDGHSEDMERSLTPPPSLEMASRDADLTALSDLHESEGMMEVEGLVIETHEISRGGSLPPPPPAMDDPSDPPPSIDSDFRSPDVTRQTPPHTSPSSRPLFLPSEPPRLHTSSPIPTSREPQPPHTGHAPPPYLVPGNPIDQEHVARPPPYMD